MFHATTESSFRSATRDFETDRYGAERVARCAHCGCESTDLDWAGRCPGEACALASRIDAGEEVLDRETPDAYDADADLTASVPCTGCQRATPRYALDTTGRCPTCPAADAHRCVIREGARSLVALAVAVLTGAYLTAWDHAELGARADAAREAWIAAVESEGDAPPPPWSSQWDPAHDALSGEVAA